jgi:4-amino-4-deoxy-L-arabinose transferase-like glycosyltransferase
MKFRIGAYECSILDAIAVLICSVPAFYLLDVPSIYIWDEAVYVNAAWDMAHGQSWLLPEEGSYNTKPPLVLWLQAISLWLFEVPELAVRFPSALSVTGILIMMVFALRRWGADQWTRILVMAAFVGHEGFIRHHISRTADLDAVMTLFVSGYVFVALDGLYFKRWSLKHTIWFFMMLTGAFYAKSIAGWLMLGPLGVLWIFSPIRYELLKRRFWWGAIASVAACLIYYVFRASAQPGYLALTWYSEYMRMFHNVMPWHEQPLSYYFINFISLKTFSPWIFLVALAVVIGWIKIREKITRQQLIRWTCISFGYLILISIPAVKLEWYDAPVYPFFALILGTVAGFLTKNLSAGMKYLWLLPIGFILWRKMNFIQNDIFPRHPFEYEGAMLRTTDVTDDTRVFMPVQTPEHRLQLDFYRKIIRDKYGEDVEILEAREQIREGDRLILTTENLAQLSNLSLDTIHVWPELGYEVLIK